MFTSSEFKRRTGHYLNEGWGMTETSPAATFTPLVGERRNGSCGLPMPGITISMRSTEDPLRQVPHGERGEMCVAGPKVIKGYWKTPRPPPKR